MPWCPQCKTEYQEGFTECNDCKVPLVDKLEEAKVEFIPFLQSEDLKLAEKLAKFFEYSELDCEISYDEEYEEYTLSIPPEYEDDAKKLYAAFYTVEQERAVQEAMENATKKIVEENEGESSDSDKDYEVELDVDQIRDDSKLDDMSLSETSDEEAVYDKSKEASSYVMKADEYKDLSGTVTIFLLFGIAGLAFVILNIVGIISLLNGWLPNIVMGLVFLSFIYVGVSTNKKAQKVRSEIDAENKLTSEINEWLKANLTQDFLSSIHNDEISEEANYIRYIDTIKEMLLKEFGPQNLAYLDRVIDDYYSTTFDYDVV